MGWLIAAAVLTVALGAAWWYDRRVGVDHTRMPGPEQRAAAEADQWSTQNRSDSTPGF
jgi:hypothetical protein